VVPLMFNRCFPVPGDLELTEDGTDIVLFHGAARVKQSIQVGAQIFRGSWRYDRQKGVPYFEDILVAGPELERVRRRFHELLTSTPGVATVTRVDLRLDRSEGTMYVDFAAVVETGEVLADSLEFALAG
jgi:hypothetical protein